MARELEARLSDRRPKFIFSISGVLWAYNQQHDLTVFFLSAEIINQGEPSIASQWSAKYSINTASEAMTAFYLNDVYSLTIGNEVIKFTTKDLLNVRTLSEQVERGGHRGGRLLFTVPGNRKGAGRVTPIQNRCNVP